MALLIANILELRQELKSNNDNLRQNLTNTLGEYQRKLDMLENKGQRTTTLKAMIDEGKLRKRSATYKYYIWLGLAICVLMIAIRQLKK